MATRISSIKDLRTWVDTQFQENQSTLNYTHEDIVRRVAIKICDNSPDSLRLGEDWSAYLETVSVYEILENLDVFNISN